MTSIEIGYQHRKMGCFQFISVKKKAQKLIESQCQNKAGAISFQGKRQWSNEKLLHGVFLDQPTNVILSTYEMILKLHIRAILLPSSIPSNGLHSTRIYGFKYYIFKMTKHSFLSLF